MWAHLICLDSGSLYRILKCAAWRHASAPPCCRAPASTACASSQKNRMAMPPTSGIRCGSPGAVQEDGESSSPTIGTRHAQTSGWRQSSQDSSSQQPGWQRRGMQRCGICMGGEQLQMPLPSDPYAHSRALVQPRCSASAARRCCAPRPRCQLCLMLSLRPACRNTCEHPPPSP